MNMDDDEVTAADIARKAGIFLDVCRRLEEHVAPANVMLLVFAARQIAAILVLESCFRHGFSRPDLAEYHARLCRDRDQALARLQIENPYPVRLI
jgi:hypothetical protein